MSSVLESQFDHVAVAVEDIDKARRHWEDELGGGSLGGSERADFHTHQLRYANGARLELIAPAPSAAPGAFVRKFLDRFGSGIHHLTFTVPDIRKAIEVLEQGGLRPVDIRLDNERWEECFLRPRDVGGVVVQIASTTMTTDEDWAAAFGLNPTPPASDAMELLGPRLRHPDLARARSLWELLGAEVHEGTKRDNATLQCSWPESALGLVVEEGSPTGPVGLLGDRIPPAVEDRLLATVRPLSS